MNLLDFEEFKDNQSALTKYIKSKINEALNEKEAVLCTSRRNIIKKDAEDFALTFAKSHPETYSDELELLAVNADITYRVIQKIDAYTTYQLHDAYIKYVRNKRFDQFMNLLLIPVDYFFMPILWKVNISFSRRARRASQTAFFMTVIDYFQRCESIATNQESLDIVLFDDFIEDANLAHPPNNGVQIERIGGIHIRQVFNVAAISSALTIALIIIPYYKYLTPVNLVVFSLLATVCIFFILIVISMFVNNYWE